MKRIILSIVLLLSTSLTLANEVANIPEGITISIPVPPGGPADQYARHLQKFLKPLVSGPVVVEYNPGAGGVTGINHFVNNYSSKKIKVLLINDQLLVHKYMNKKLDFDPATRVTPVGFIGRTPYVFAVNSKIGVTRFQTLKLSKTQDLNLALPGVGTFIHYAAINLEQQTKFNMMPIQYQGTAKIIPDLIGNQVQATVLYPQSLVQFAERGQLNILAISGDHRDEKLPNTPTFQELGLNMPPSTFWAVFIDSSASAETKTQVQNLISTAINNPESQAALKDIGVNTKKEKNLAVWWKNINQYYQKTASTYDFSSMAKD